MMFTGRAWWEGTSRHRLCLMELSFPLGEAPSSAHIVDTTNDSEVRVLAGAQRALLSSK